MSISSAYFLSRFPTCFLIAVEPDTNNFALLTKNLSPYQGRYLAVQAAVWPEKTVLYFEPASMSTECEWGRRVTSDKQPSEPVQAVDVQSLMALTDYDRISLLKVDIEGAERELFVRNYASWLDQTENFCIEVHGDESREVVVKPLPADLALSSSGELMVGQRAVPISTNVTVDRETFGISM